MSKAVFFASAAVAALAFSTGGAQAQCAPNNPSSGQTVTCASNDTNGFSDGSNDVTVNINAGVTVSNSGDAIKVDGDRNVINNSGALQGGDEGVQIEGPESEVHNFAGASITGVDNGVQIEGDDTTLANAAGASISGGDRGIEAEDAEGVVITNAGTITGQTSDGVRAGSGASITNEATGVISGGDDGIQIADDNATITNHGTISALAVQADGGSSEGITGGDNITLINTGTLEADDDAFQTGLNANITNTGLIRSVANDGIDIDTGMVLNAGTIIAEGVEDGIDFDAGVDPLSVSTIENQAGGLISGVIGVNVDADNNARQFITNAGTITGTSGVAVYLEEGDDAFSLLSSGLVNGTVDLGEGDDVLSLLGPQMSLVGGGGLFDGGADTDTIIFDEVASADIVSLTIASLASTLQFKNADGSLSTLLFANFEWFSLTDGVFAIEDFASAVPIPAAGFLFAGALGLFGAAQRKTRKTA